MRIGSVREDLEALLREASLVAIALGIALGWSVFQVARGVADLVTGLLTKYPSGSDATFALSLHPVAWVVRGRILTLGSLIAGLVELAVVLVFAAWLAKRAVGRPTP